MLEISQILCPTDFSRCAANALPYSADLAQRFDARLHLFHSLVVHDVDPGNAAHPLPNMEELYRALEEHAASELRRMVEQERVEIRTAQRRGISAAGGILEYADEHDIDLIVMATHGRRGLKRLLLGSVAEEIVRLASCPVMTVPQCHDGGGKPNIASVLVPIDFSDHARLAIDYAGELASLFDANLHLLHVVDEVIYPDFYPPILPPGGQLSDDLRDRSLERLRQLAAELGDVAPSTQLHVRAGRAAPEIGAFADERSTDLIVIASHGLTGLSHMLLGSVTEQVVRRAPCPVFTVKAFAKSEIGASSD